MNHGDNKAITQTHFSLMLKKGTSRTTDLNWEHILEPDCDLSDLDGDFMEGEVKGAIFGSSSDKAPGPYSFIRAFYKACWRIIKPEIMQVINNFHDLYVANLHWINSAKIFLIPTKDGVEDA
jgi:hypothetical protein